MSNKKNNLLICDVCDTRKIKEEDYSDYEKIMINADVVVVSDSSKSVLNRLPVTINQDCSIEVPDDIDVELKTVDGSYEITETTAVSEHTVLIVNGSLNIHPLAEEVLRKYEKILVNGNVRYPKSLEGYLTRLSVNGSVSIYPDDCDVLEDTFVLDKYFPVRAKEGKKYYVKDKVVIKDKTVDFGKLVQKKVEFFTEQLIVPEEMVESCVALFDEKVEFTVIPSGMSLHYGDAVLNKELLEKEGSNIYVYGDLMLPEDIEAESLTDAISKLVVKGKVVLSRSQEDSFKKLNVEYSHLEFRWEGRIIENKPNVRIDKTLLELSPDKVLVRNIAAIKISSDVTPHLILDRLEIENCAKVFCSEEQESVIAAIAKNTTKIGESEEKTHGIMEEIKDLRSTRIINANSFIM